MKGQQKLEVPIPFCHLEFTSKQPDKSQRNSPQIHILHINVLKSILHETIATFEAQSLISDSQYMCLDVDNLPKLVQGIIERRCHTIDSKDLRLVNDIGDDEDGLFYKSDEGSDECWSPRDGRALSARKALSPRNKCKTKNRGLVSMGKGDVARVVSRIMSQRSGHLPRKALPILNPEDIPNLLLQENIKPSQSMDRINVGDIPKLIMQMMDGEISVPFNDIFDETPRSLIECRSENGTELFPRTNNREVVTKLAQQLISQELSKLEKDVNKSIEVLSKEILIEANATTSKQQTDPVATKLSSPKLLKRLAKVSSALTDIRCRTTKRYMEPTLSSTARATFEDPFCAPSRFTKNLPANGVARPPEPNRQSAKASKSDKAASSGNPKYLGRRYVFKECIRPWESPFHNPNRLYCLEEVTKESKKSKAEKRLLESVRTSRPSPRPVVKSCDTTRKAQVTKSETDLTDEGRFCAAGDAGQQLLMRKTYSVERLIRVAERLKTVVRPMARKPDWDSAPKWSPKEEVISLDHEIGMKIIDKMIKPKKMSNMYKTRIWR